MSTTDTTSLASNLPSATSDAVTIDSSMNSGDRLPPLLTTPQLLTESLPQESSTTSPTSSTTNEATTGTKDKNNKPVRAMLARGAACDLCRARKVKCTGEKPICAQCLKSARGNAAACNCVYDGSGAVKLNGPKKPRVKKSQLPSQEQQLQQQREGSSQSQEGASSALLSTSIKSQSSETVLADDVTSVNSSAPSTTLPLPPLRPYEQPHPFQRNNFTSPASTAPANSTVTPQLSATTSNASLDPLFNAALNSSTSSAWSNPSVWPQRLPQPPQQPYATPLTNGQITTPLLPSISAFYQPTAALGASTTREKRSYREMMQPGATAARPVITTATRHLSDDEDDDVEEEEQLLAEPLTSTATQDKPSALKKQATDVEALTERIIELEKRLKAQSTQPQIAPRVSVASPSYFAASPYPSSSATFGPVSPYGGPGSPYHARSLAMDHRRSLSRSGEIPINTNISSAWTPESSCRFDADGPNADGYTSIPRTRPSSSSGAYASFIPPSSYGEAMPSASSVNRSVLNKHAMPSYPNNSSYPPLDFDGTSVPTPPSSGSGGPSPPSNNDWKATTNVSDSGFVSSDNGLQSPEDTFPLDASLYQILYPAWDPALPGPAVVQRVVQVFLTRASFPKTMFDKARFLDNLKKPPTDPSFPESILLHAMMAYAVNFVARESLVEGFAGVNTPYWSSEKSPREYHFKAAKHALITSSSKSNQLQLVQAAIILCYTAHQMAEFHDLWKLTSYTIRQCVMLGLNHLSPPGQRTYPEWSKLVKGTHVSGAMAILGPARDTTEQYLRSAIFWNAFAIDRLASAATDWACSIDEKDITTHLPYLAAADGSNAIDMTIETMTGQMTSLSIWNPKLFLEKSAPIGSFGLYVKAIVLLGRVTTYLQRLPRIPRLPEGETCASFRSKVMQTPQFIEIDRAVSKYRSFAGADFFGKDGQLDLHLASAYCIPHVANILLNESMVSSNDEGQDSPLEKCLRSANCIVTATYLVASSIEECSGADPFFPFIWSVVGRALVRDYAIRSTWGQHEAASTSRQLAEQILQFAEQAVRVAPIGTTVGVGLRKLMANPECLIPIDADPECGIIPEFAMTRWDSYAS